MQKILQILTLIVGLMTQKSIAQSDVLYFDKTFKKVADERKSKYTVNLDTARFQTVVHTKKNSRVYARGKIYPADYLTFDGKAVFAGPSGGLTAVRYYKNGELLPLIFIDEKYRKKPENKAAFYMAISEKGFFYAYAINFRTPNLATDDLFAIGQVTDTATLRLNGRCVELDNRGAIIDTKKYKNGVLVPFIESTLDIKEPYEVIKVITHTARISSADGIEYEHGKFIKKCRDTGADGVIGIKTSLSPIGGNDAFGEQNVVIQGTTIRLKNEEKSTSN
jgi:hypothetical protein